MFLDLLDQPVSKGDLIVHIDKVGSVMGIVDKVTENAIYYVLLNQPTHTGKYFVRIRERVLKVFLNGTTCMAGYPTKTSQSIEYWLDKHRQYGRSC